MVPVILIALLLQAGPARTKSGAKPASKTPTATAVPKQADRFPLRQLTLEGNRNLTKEQVLTAAGLSLNQLAGKSDFDAARDKLLATGMFESVGFRFGPAENGQGYAANIEVVEIPTVYPVQFSELSAPAEAIDAFLKAKNPLYGPRLPGTTLVLDQYARQIEQYLASLNKPEKVAGRLIAAGADQFKIVFRPAAAPASVSQVTFEGNKVVSNTTLRNSIGNVAFGVPYTEDGFRELLDHQIRPLYDARGLIRVKFTKLATEPDPKVKGVMVHVTVEEGPAYKLTKVTGLDQDQLKTLKVKTGETVNFDDINAGVDRLKKNLRATGYLEATIASDRKVDDKAHTLEVALTVKPGPQYQMGKLEIQGLDLIGEPAIRKLWGAKEGAPFNPSYPDYFLDRVREDRMFDGLGATKSVTHIDDKTHIADVTLIFGSSPKVDPVKKLPSAGTPY